MKEYSFLSENKPISEIVKDPRWQKCRESLVGKWNKEPEWCCAQLRNYLGPVSSATDVQLRIMWNYLSSSGFRIGRIKHQCATNLKQSVRQEIIRRKIKFR